MYVKGRATLSKFRLVCNAIVANVKGTIIRVLDRVSNTSPNRCGSDALVHENTGCEYSDYHRRGILPRGCRCGWPDRSVVIGPVEPDFPCCEPNGPWASITIQTPWGETIELRKDIAWHRRKGRRRVHRGAAKYTPKRQALPLAITGICDYPHAYFPDGKFECVGGGCGTGTGNWKRFEEKFRKTSGVDKQSSERTI